MTAALLRVTVTTLLYRGVIRDARRIILDDDGIQGFGVGFAQMSLYDSKDKGSMQHLESGDHRASATCPDSARARLRGLVPRALDGPRRDTVGKRRVGVS